MCPQRTLPALLAVVLLATAWPASAHPGVGIVMDSRGNVFYTDLKQVWRIAPDGTKSVAVPDVHTHELYLDSRDVLYGEHLWYNGERADTWGHRVWTRTPDGRVTDAVPARSGFLPDYGYSFVRDRAGAMYWVDRDHGNVFKRRTPDGRVADVARCADCRDVRWMTVAADETIYFGDYHALRAVTPAGAFRTLAASLVGGVRNLLDWDRHAVMGLWTDRAGNVYAAVAGEGVVKRVAADRRVTIVFESSVGWRPSGGLVAPNGDLWVLEFDVVNRVRATSVTVAGRRTVH
jgi:hypothetical protein